ncbi:hypothetical protein FHG87_011222 [Trinorchestia longiramus]|nr:hypothetical protein FHG87_011222 [Trinorchestia longiramus]
MDDLITDAAIASTTATSKARVKVKVRTLLNESNRHCRPTCVVTPGGSTVFPPTPLHLRLTKNCCEPAFQRQAYNEHGCTSVSQSGPYRPPGGVEEMQGGDRRVRLEWGAYITV